MSAPKPGCEHILAQTAATCGHLEELRSLLTQSSWEVVSPFPTMLQVLLFFLRCVVPSPSDPDSHSESESDELELEELEESLELSEAMPVDSWRSTASARTASSGCSCFKILYHFLDNFGLPLTVLCHTTGKLVLLAKFWVMAMVVSRLRTTCHQPLVQRQFLLVSVISPGV